MEKGRGDRWPMSEKNSHVRWKKREEQNDGSTHWFTIIAEKTENGWHFYKKNSSALWYEWCRVEPTDELIQKAEDLLANNQGLAFPDASLDFLGHTREK